MNLFGIAKGAGSAPVSPASAFVTTLKPSPGAASDRPPCRSTSSRTPIFFGQIALADPSKSGSAVKSLEMIIQQEMNRRSAELAQAGLPPSGVDERAPSEGWERAMRLIRRLSANARYFTDAASKIPTDVAMGNAEAGMCIDFYGRVEATRRGKEGPLGCALSHPAVAPRWAPTRIALLRGAPHRELALAFPRVRNLDRRAETLGFQSGHPRGAGAKRSSAPPHLAGPLRAQVRAFSRRSRRKSLPRQRRIHLPPGLDRPPVPPDLVHRSHHVRRHPRRAARSLPSAPRTRISPRATALFDDVSMVTYDAAKGTIRETLGASRPIDEANLANRLVRTFRAQYLEVTRLAREGQ